MNLANWCFLAFLTMPALISPAFALGRLNRGPVSPGLIAAGLRILLLVPLIRFVIFDGQVVSVSQAIVENYPFRLGLSLDFFKIGILVVAEFCFLLTYTMCSLGEKGDSLLGFLILLSQLLFPLYVCSDNLMLTGAVQISIGFVFYYMVRFALMEGGSEIGERITKSLYPLYYTLGLILLFWGIAEFGSQGLAVQKASDSKLNLFLWMFLLILSVPVAPWARWLGLAVAHLPEAVTLALVIFLSAITWKVSSMFSVAYPELEWKFKLGIYMIGILGCAFSIGRLFAAQSRRLMLGSLPTFFFSLILVSIGVSQSKLLSSAYYVCLFLPVFTGLILHASAITVKTALEKSYIGILLALILGLPGTPVYLIFGTIGSRSLEMGLGYTIIFALLWFLYFSANVHICRRIFLDPEPPEAGVSSTLTQSGAAFAGFGIFLCVFIVFVTVYVGRSL